jgi:hypothetical protein
MQQNHDGGSVESLGVRFGWCGCGGVQQYWYSYPNKPFLVIKPKNNQWGVHLLKKGKLIAQGGIIAPTNTLQLALKTHYDIDLDV